MSLSKHTQFPWDPTPVTLTWTSSGATGCSISNLVDSGPSAFVAASGSVTWQNGQAPVTWQDKITLSCTGPTGTVVASEPLSKPKDLTWYGNSPEKTRWAYAPDEQLPTPGETGIQRAAGELGFAPGVGYADFTQEGITTVLAATYSHEGRYPADNPAGLPDSPALLRFLKQSSEGKWLDITDRLIPDASHRKACVRPTGIEVADLNRDKVPDAMITCVGPAFPIAGVLDERSEQYVLLSQGDGTFGLQLLPVGRIVGVQMDISDPDGDDNLDIVGADAGGLQRPFMLRGRGDGTFVLDGSAFPAAFEGQRIKTVRFLSPPGGGSSFVQRVIVSGDTPGSSPHSGETSFGTAVLQYQNGRFVQTVDLTTGIPVQTGSALRFGRLIDALTVYSVEEGQNVETLIAVRTSFDGRHIGVIRTNLETGASEVLDEIPVPPGQTLPTAAIIRWGLRLLMTNCAVSPDVPQAADPALCAYRRTDLKQFSPVPR